MDDFENKITKLYPELQSLATKLLSGDEATAKDVVQDCLVNAWLRRASIQNLNRYCVIVLKNLCFSILRQKKYLPIEDDLLVYNPGTKELARYIAEVSKTLPEVLLSTLKMKYEDGYTEQEIADLLGIHRCTVHRRLDKARKLLKEKVKLL